MIFRNLLQPMKTILVTGASGLIGSHLCKTLAEKGHHIRVLGRSKRPNVAYEQYVWDVKKKQLDANAIIGVDVIIHLAGANISEGRWNENRKKEIIESRVATAQLLLQTVQETKTQLEAFISSSAIGYYGAQTVDTVFNESHPAANDFIAKVCVAWEEAAKQFEQIPVRTVCIRTGVVLTEEGGPLAKMKMPVSFGVGSGLGKGSQYLPWIHVDDLVGIYIKAVEDDTMKASYNGVAPEHITNEAFIKTIGKVLKKKVWLPNVPRVVLKLLFGEMAVIFLEGSRVSAEKIQEIGYEFQYPTAQKALKQLLDK